MDSEDLPLNISRETMQDSALLQKLNRVLTGLFLKFLEEEAKSDADKYIGFFKEFGHFLIERWLRNQGTANSREEKGWTLSRSWIR